MTNAEAVIIGAIQGVSEWLPIGDAVHVNLAPSLLGWKFINAPYTAFRAIIQIGPLLAAYLYLWKDIVRMISPGSIDDPDELSSGGSGRILVPLIFGCIPAILIQSLLRHRAQVWASHWIFPCAGTILLGLLFFHAEGGSRQGRKMSDVSVVDGFFVGIGQALGIGPGLSQSSASLFLAMELGFEKSVAARFAFLLYLPAYTLFTVTDFFHYKSIIIASHLTHAVLLGSLAACIAAYLSLAMLIQFLRSQPIYLFAVYRVLLGGFILWLIAQHLLV
jgi:undecaprenyl-diphosphatase